MVLIRSSPVSMSAEVVRLLGIIRLFGARRERQSGPGGLAEIGADRGLQFRLAGLLGWNDGRAGPELLLAVDDDHLAHLQSGFHQRDRAFDLSDADRAKFSLVVGADDI